MAATSIPSQAAGSPAPSVVPSIPLPSLNTTSAIARLDLTATATVVLPGTQVELTATASSSTTGTGQAIAIFDLSSQSPIGVCSDGAQCIVDYSAGAGVRYFAAFISAPTANLRDIDPSSIASLRLAVDWVGVSLAAADPAVGPGKAVTLTATSTMAAGPGNLIQFYSVNSNARLTYCEQGNTCSVSLTSSSAGSRSIVAVLGKASAVVPVADFLAHSDSLTVTWLAASLSGGSAYQLGGSTYLTATANADLTNTPWRLAIVDSRGHVVGPSCKTGNSCTAQVSGGSGTTPPYSAVIGAEPSSTSVGKLGQLLQRVVGPSTLVNVQARSGAITPKRLLWGVDSCKTFADDPTARSGLYPEISGILGAPDFWGRYLTDAVCPPLSRTEVAAAHALHMGILPIYNERDCSNLSGYDTGLQYAAEAVAAARGLGMPDGRGIAIDIEPPGDACPGAANLDTGLIHGWYDGITRANYSAVFYSDATAGSVFATQWCYTVNALPYIGEHAYLWSFQPSLRGGYMKSNAPGFAPNLTGCLGYVHAWQYQIGSSSWAAPDVDGDEATSELPIWYP